MIGGLLLGLTVFGVVGLRIITGGSWFDCLYMTVITLTTVGYAETLELGTSGRVFVMFYLVTGLGVFTFSAFTLGQWIVSAPMQTYLERRRMENRIGKLRDHFIVCGFGRMGRTICEYLHSRGKPFIVIDLDEVRTPAVCREHGWPHVIGDATSDEVLLESGITDAKALASVLPTDADNIYVVLSARILSSRLQIIARASDERARKKLEHAGATRVVSPFSAGAVKIARFLITPQVEEFLEIADPRGMDFEMADIEITADSPFAGRTLEEGEFHRRNLVVVGMRRADGAQLIPPPRDTVIEPGDCLFLFGAAETVDELIGERRPLTE